MIDKNIINRMRSVGGKKADGSSMLVKVLTMYLKQAPEYLKQLNRSIEEGDLEKAGDIAHTLKSSNAAVGATELSALYAKIEERVKIGYTDMGGFRVAMQEINHNYQQVEIEFKRILVDEE